jgi:hypothetical protein
MDPADLQSVLRVVEGYDAADCLAYVWDADPTGHPHAFVQLVVGCAKHNGESAMSCSTVSKIKSFVPDAALRKLGPITKVGYGQIKEVIQIGQYGQRYENISDDNASDDNASDDPFEKIESGDWRSEDFGGDDFTSDGTKVILGPVVERLRDLGLEGLEPRSVAGAARSLVGEDNLSKVVRLFSKNTAPTADSRDGGRDGSRRRGNEPNILSEGEFFSTPPFARLNAYRGQFRPDLVRSTENTACGNSDTACGILGLESRDRRTIADISMARCRYFDGPSGGASPPRAPRLGPR